MSGYIRVHKNKSKQGKMQNNIYEIVFDRTYIDECISKRGLKEEKKKKKPCTKKQDTEPYPKNVDMEPCPTFRTRLSRTRKIWTLIVTVLIVTVLIICI